MLRQNKMQQYSNYRFCGDKDLNDESNNKNMQQIRSERE